MTDDHEGAKPRSRGLAYFFIFGGILVVAGVVDIARSVLHLHSVLSNLWIVVIVLVGIVVGATAFALFSKHRRPTTAHRAPI